MEPLRRSVYATSTRPTNAQCSGTCCVRFPIGAGLWLSTQCRLYRKANWTRVGAAWSHKDGKGFNVTLDALPVSGKLTIRKYEPKANNEEQGA